MKFDYSNCNDFEISALLLLCHIVDEMDKSYRLNPTVDTVFNGIQEYYNLKQKEIFEKMEDDVNV